MDPCCNATTCQFRSYGTPCRAASGQCDIEEYCSGYSSVCPDDTILQDGSSCNNNTAYCYDGVCQTYDDQCRFHFGMNVVCNILKLDKLKYVTHSIHVFTQAACVNTCNFILHSVQLLVRDQMYVTQYTIHEETSLETVGIQLLDSFPVPQGVQIKRCLHIQMCMIYH